MSFLRVALVLTVSAWQSQLRRSPSELAGQPPALSGFVFGDNAGGNGWLHPGDTHLGQTGTFLDVFDGNTRTFMDVIQVGQNSGFAGIELDAPSKVRCVQVMPRAYMAGRMVGAVLEGRNPYAAQWSVLHKIDWRDFPVEFGWLAISIPFFQQGPYTALRYVGAPGAYSNVAEVRFLPGDCPSVPERASNIPKPVSASARNDVKARLRAEWKMLGSYAKNLGTTSSMSLPMQQSMGFYEAVPRSEWLLRAAIAGEQSKQNLKHSKASSVVVKNAADWWTENWHASWSCAAEVRLGGVGDGGKWVCDPNRVEPGKCLVWSAGSAGDFGFEEAMHEELGCEIHTFDMGDFGHLAPSFVKYHRWGLSAVSEVTPNGVFKTLKDSLFSLGQLDRKIDIFKMDIEGAEFDVLLPILQTPGNYLARNVRQFLVEIHEKPPPELHALMAAFLKNGFHVYHKEPNTFGCMGKCVEIAFVRLDLPVAQHAATLASFRGVKAFSYPAKLRQLIFERQMLHQSMQPGDGWFPMGDPTGVSKAAIVPRYKILLHEYAQRGSAWYQYNWEACVSCAAKRRVGGHWLCDPQALFSSKQCMVYLANNERVVDRLHSPTAFALHIKGEYACRTHVQPNLDQFRAQLESDKTAHLIDFLQVNLHGGEFVSLLPLVRNRAFHRTVKQVSVRLHFAKALLRMAMPGSNRTPDALNDELLAAFFKAGYAIFAKEFVATAECEYGNCADYYFVRGDLVSLDMARVQQREKQGALNGVHGFGRKQGLAIALVDASNYG